MQLPFEKEINVARAEHEEATKLEVSAKAELDNWNATNQDTNTNATWELKHVFCGQDLRKTDARKCMTEQCGLVACSRWVSTIPSEPDWYSCMDCQER